MNLWINPNQHTYKRKGMGDSKTDRILERMAITFTSFAQS